MANLISAMAAAAGFDAPCTTPGLYSMIGMEQAPVKVVGYHRGAPAAARAWAAEVERRGARCRWASSKGAARHRWFAVAQVKVAVGFLTAVSAGEATGVAQGCVEYQRDEDVQVRREEESRMRGEEERGELYGACHSTVPVMARPGAVLSPGWKDGEVPVMHAVMARLVLNCN